MFQINDNLDIYITAITLLFFSQSIIAFYYHFVLIINSWPGYCLFNLYQIYGLFQSIITQVVDISILNLFSLHSIFLIVSITVERWQVCKKFVFFWSDIFANVFRHFLFYSYTQCKILHTVLSRDNLGTFKCKISWPQIAVVKKWQI